MSIDNLLTQISFCTVEEKMRILNVLTCDPVLKPVINKMFEQYTKELNVLKTRISEVERIAGGMK